MVDACEDEALRAARQEASNYKYAKAPWPWPCPVAYCLLDAAGTFADNRVLETLNEDSANVAYELTFLLAAVVCFIYVVLIKRTPLIPKLEAPKYIGAVCETAGQFAYIYAIADTEHRPCLPPIISSYCAASVLWSRIFLKEKLSWKHYLMILLIIIGIAIMGFFRYVNPIEDAPAPYGAGASSNTTNTFTASSDLHRILLDLLIQPGHEKGQGKIRPGSTPPTTKSRPPHCTMWG